MANRSEYKWCVLFADGRTVPASERELLAWFSDLTSWLDFLAKARTREPAEMTMQVGGRPPALTKVIDAELMNGRSTYANPLGLPDAPQPL